ncbi:MULTISPECIES: GNAT family N-acetyltransferase [unclassified Paenibacillus]|uniref:GNAT family N-acetyltransferase n=1 Tax=unclassified Paenibacillus TaxID=185978 RepID=UPI00061E7B99|nr:MULTISPECIES: GNAT family N-acetyltransferase [unclassified Paenibacillus]KKC47121.1 GCN5 family acetyltransferase [Paenibacillus sp. D9]
MGNVRLTVPDLRLEKEYKDFYEEWVESGEDMVPWVIAKEPADFAGMVEWLEKNSAGIGLPEGWVPDSTFWLVDETERVLGAVNIRHSLTPFLLSSGGHIGYGIRPSARRKGYATKLLELALEKTAELGIAKVLVVCDRSNEASARTILNNGGIEAAPHTEENGNVVRRFWIGG